MTVPERDWRLLRTIHDVALERYCARILQECTAIARSADGSSHDRYLRLFRLLKERDDSIATAFNDLRRSTAIHRLAGMILLGVVGDDELSQLSEATRESAKTLVDLRRPGKKRRNPQIEP